MPETRTLVVAPNWVGDCVMAEPVVRAFARSGRRVSLLAKRPLHALLRLFEGVEATLDASGTEAEVVARLAAPGFDEAAVLPGSFRSALRVARAGIPRRYGYRSELRGPLLAPALPKPSRRRPQVEDYRELLAAAGVPAPADWIPRLRLPAPLRALGSERLARARIDPADAAAPLVGIFPGAEWGPSKRWPMMRFAEVARELRRRRPQLRAVILAGPKEVWLAVRVHEESGKLHPVIGPDLDLAGLAAVLARLDLLITNDSGPMHLAAALGVPTIALFGPTDPRRTAPAGAGHVVLHRDPWCSPCFRRRCPLLHHRCLRGISAAAVANAALAALDRPEGPRPD